MRSYGGVEVQLHVIFVTEAIVGTLATSVTKDIAETLLQQWQPMLLLTYCIDLASPYRQNDRGYRCCLYLV